MDLFDSVLSKVVADTGVHCRWVNTLSMMENVGARKIAASQHPRKVTEDILRHSFEESRHAWYLKRQIEKLSPGVCPTYEDQYLLAPRKSRNYLHLLDVQLAREVSTELSLVGFELRQACYVLVTYAIEVRADDLYGRYDKQLKLVGCPVSVKAIIADEKTHLEEMHSAISHQFERPDEWILKARNIELGIFTKWLNYVSIELAV